MSPSILHESRVGTLDALARLAGCGRTVELDRHLHPDVVRSDWGGRRLFVGEAKATETAGCQATARRLRRYLRSVRSWQDAGFDVRLAVCGGDQKWVDRLLTLAAQVGNPACHQGWVRVGDDPVAWIDLPPTGATSPSPP